MALNYTQLLGLGGGGGGGQSIAQSMALGMQAAGQDQNREMQQQKLGLQSQNLELQNRRMQMVEDQQLRAQAMAKEQQRQMKTMTAELGEAYAGGANPDAETILAIAEKAPLASGKMKEILGMVDKREAKAFFTKTVPLVTALKGGEGNLEQIDERLDKLIDSTGSEPEKMMYKALQDDIHARGQDGIDATKAVLGMKFALYDPDKFKIMQEGLDKAAGRPFAAARAKGEAEKVQNEADKILKEIEGMDGEGNDPEMKLKLVKQVGDLTKEYRKASKTFLAAQVFMNAIVSPVGSGISDYGRRLAFGKMIDMGSTVRGFEYNAIDGAAGIIQQGLGWWKKNVDENGNLSDTARKQLQITAREYYEQMAAHQKREETSMRNRIRRMPFKYVRDSEEDIIGLVGQGRYDTKARLESWVKSLKKPGKGEKNGTDIYMKQLAGIMGEDKARSIGATTGQSAAVQRALGTAKPAAKSSPAGAPRVKRSKAFDAWKRRNQ